MLVLGDVSLWDTPQSYLSLFDTSLFLTIFDILSVVFSLRYRFNCKVLWCLLLAKYFGGKYIDIDISVLPGVGKQPRFMRAEIRQEFFP